jgi:hypothetical protein
MRIRSVLGHSGQAVAEALLVAAIIAGVLLALSPIYAPARDLAGTGDAAAARSSGHITVDGPVSYGGTTTATVNPGGTDVYVFVQCYAPNMDGKYVYAAYSPVNSRNVASIGPLASALWTSGGASCTAQEGYFTRNGFGKWVVSASTTFKVTP